MGTSLATSGINRVIAAAAIALSGCVESSFMLAQDSRLPAWFEVPPGQNRSELAVKMEYRVLSTGREATFVLLDARGHELQFKRAHLRGLEPTKTGGSYPVFEIAAVNGTTEVIEHRKVEPVFRINDDPAVRAKLGEAGPRMQQSDHHAV